MRGYLRKCIQTHKYFVEAVVGILLRRKGFTIDEYMDMICEPRIPIDEVAIVLLAHLYKIHVCIFIGGKYFITNQDKALDKTTIYLVYCGKNVFYDTTSKGSLHWSLKEAPESTYNLCRLQPKEVVELSTPAPTVGC